MTEEEIFSMAVKCYLISPGNREGFYGDALIQFAKLVEEKALAQPEDPCKGANYSQASEQEPVAWAGVDFDINTTPPQRKPLTDEQIMANDVLRYHFALNGGAGPISKKGRKVIDAIEAAHGIKENT